MDQQRYIDLIDELRAQPAETPWLEFKNSLDDEKRIGLLISALSNGARLEDRTEGFLVWGVEDGTHAVVGTRFDPATRKVGNQDLLMWLRERLNPAPAFRFHTIDYSGRPVVLLEIPAATSMPTTYNDIAYIRVGSATPKLSRHPELYQALTEKLRPYVWERGVAAGYQTPEDVVRLLDLDACFSLLYPDRSPPQTQNQSLAMLEADRLISSEPGGRWSILNLGAILFARELREFGTELERKGVRFMRYDGVSEAADMTKSHDGRKGYAAGFKGLLAYINTLVPENEQIGQALRKSAPLFPPRAIRELVANALIHQDMTIAGAGPMIKLFANRMEISNPGRPLIEPDRMIDQPPVSRNRELARLMYRMRMCEERGSGMKKVFNAVELFQLPAPSLRASEHAMQAILYGPRAFSEMTEDERINACYWHTVLVYVTKGERMRNCTLCERFGLDPKKGAAQATAVIHGAMSKKRIKYADENSSRKGYHPFWA